MPVGVLYVPRLPRRSVVPGAAVVITWVDPFDRFGVADEEVPGQASGGP
ncbi:hypothetical protein [Candidatus Protofrankia californiensis]|nr:hypothetical protein [Candidatus Protofrankia californiensis]